MHPPGRATRDRLNRPQLRANEIVRSPDALHQGRVRLRVNDAAAVNLHRVVGLPPD